METDDSESLVRPRYMPSVRDRSDNLHHRMEPGCNGTIFQPIHDAIDAYEKDLPNLMKRSNVVDFNTDESCQTIGYWPSAEYLRKRTVFGSKQRGMDKIGKDNISDGSNLIIKQPMKTMNAPWI